MVRVFSGAKIGSDMCGKGKRLNAILALSQLSYGPVERAHAQMRAVSDSGQFKLAALICQQIYEKSRLAPQGTILQDGRDAVLDARCKSYQLVSEAEPTERKMKTKRKPKICRVCCETARQSRGWKTVKGNKLVKANVCHACAHVLQELGTTIWLGPAR